MIHVITGEGSDCIFKASGVTQTCWGAELVQCVQSQALLFPDFEFFLAHP